VTLEDIVAKEWAKDKGLKVRRIGIIANQDQPWMRATLDRMVSGCPEGRCAVEVKTRSSYVAKEWAEGAPKDVAAQVDWQLIVSGLDHIHVIALIGGQRLAHHIIYAPKDKRRAELIDAARLVWDAVASGEAPKLPEALWTDAYLDQLHTDRAGSVEIPLTTAELVIEYNELLMVIKDLETDKAEMRTKLVGQLGDFEIGTLNGQQVYSFKSQTKRSFDRDALAALYPDVHKDERLWNSTTTRSLRTSQRKETKNDN
jgi:predicted phage-related endonuclease